MSKKKDRNKRKQTASHHTNTPSEMIFTMQVVKILKESLTNVEIILLANSDKQIKNIELAKETFYELKQKLTDMLEREEWEEVKAFDYNEAWILYASLAMYVVELQLGNGGDTAKLPLCLALRNQFNAIIEGYKPFSISSTE